MNDRVSGASSVAYEPSFGGITIKQDGVGPVSRKSASVEAAPLLEVLRSGWRLMLQQITEVEAFRTAPTELKNGRFWHRVVHNEHRL